MNWKPLTKAELETGRLLLAIHDENQAWQELDNINKRIEEITIEREKLGIKWKDAFWLTKKLKRELSMSTSVNYAWKFLSSDGKRIYETLRYTDGSVSCDCPGWTRRVGADGDRTCKHCREVQMGTANQSATSHGPVGCSACLPTQAGTEVKSGSKVAASTPSFKRLFS